MDEFFRGEFLPWPQARLEIEALYDGVDFSETLTRARFEVPARVDCWMIYG